jgi:serine/threonine-protein kinase HipA
VDDEFLLLHRVGGDDLPGGVRVVDAARGGAGPPSHADNDEDDDDPEGDTSASGPLKFSLAGVQLKFSIKELPDRGLTLPTTGEAGTWIAKLPDLRVGHDHVPEAEMGALELARAIGLETPTTRLVDASSIGRLPEWADDLPGKALLVARFDRGEGGLRTHAEVVAQVLDVPTRLKYDRANFETIGRTVMALSGEGAIPSFIDRLVLNALVGNGDAHTKNWAFIYPDGRNPVLSPVYDVVPTILYVANNNLGLNLGGSKAFSEIRLASFERLGRKIGWDGDRAVEQARSAVDRVQSNWTVLANYLGAEALERITAHRDSVPLAHDV